MNDLVEILDLEPAIESVGKFENQDFEEVYAKLAGDRRYDHIRRDVEQKVANYFSSLQLPEPATIYDRILLSLRPGDAVFTFNWDPFLFDAYKRNVGVASLPKIFFLHGNVRITEAPLLYPVDKKGYSGDPYISERWKAAEDFVGKALVLTVFGYRAPASDVDAVDLLKSAWMERSRREMEHVEIIDIAPRSELVDRWEEFTPTHHLHPRRHFDESWMARWPRRSREAVFIPMSTGMPCQDFPLSRTEDLARLQEEVLGIAKWEAAEYQEAN